VACSELGLLPAELAARSLSDREIVLSYADALAAIGHLSEAGRRSQDSRCTLQLLSGRSLCPSVFAPHHGNEIAAHRATRGVQARQQRNGRLQRRRRSVRPGVTGAHPDQRSSEDRRQPSGRQ